MQSVLDKLGPNSSKKTSNEASEHEKQLAPSTILDPSLLDKVAIITGGTRGIGRATALHLAKAGFHLALSYGSSTKDFEETKALVDALGKKTRVLGIKADLGTQQGAVEVVSKTVEEFGKIDVLVNNAGIAIYHDLFQATVEDLDKTYHLNYRAPFLLTQAAVPHMPKGGRIIFISSSLSAASTVTPPYAVYLPSKGSIEQLARVLAKTLGAAPYSILVNTVSPGPTATELFFEGKSEQLIKTFEGFSPFGRLGKPEEIAQAIGFFATSGTWVSGQNLRVNGGSVL